MALKSKINKEKFDKLPEALKSEYIERDGEYVLDIEGAEDTGALKRSKDREKQLRHDAEAELRKAQEKLDSLEDNDARKRGDIETLEKLWQKKLDDQKTESDGKLSSKDGFIKKTLIDNKALEIANKISGDNAAVILPHIVKRITADLDGESPVTKVLGADGTPSEMSLADLSKEFVANKDFAAIIIGSKASGSGTPDKTNNLGGGAGGDDKKMLSDLSGKDLVEVMKAKKEAQE